MSTMSSSPALRSDAAPVWVLKQDSPSAAANASLPEPLLPACWCHLSAAATLAYQPTNHCCLLPPARRRVDYIAATCPDLLALTVFQAGLVTVDLEGAAFKGVLPLYVSEDHFSRALPHLPPLLRQLAPHRWVGARVLHCRYGTV